MKEIWKLYEEAVGYPSVNVDDSVLSSTVCGSKFYR
jgi:hypothetical protein